MQDWKPGDEPTLDELIKAVERRGYCHKCLMAFAEWKRREECKFRQFG